MTIKKVPGGTYLSSWRIQEFKAKAKKRAARPKRNILSVKAALDKLNLKYCQEVSMWSTFHRGKQDNLTAGLLWVDFVVRQRGNRRPFVLIMDDPKIRWKAYEKRYLVTKQAELTRRGIPYLLLPPRLSSQEYWILIYRFMKKKGA